MDKEKMLEIIKKLPFDRKKAVYSDGETEIYLLRPSELSSRFAKYDVKKNFQIWLKQGSREFRPNHLRVFIDLNLRIRSNPAAKKVLLLAFDKIFYGEDPKKVLAALAKRKFGLYLNGIQVIGCLAQLFILEQEYAYHRESNFEPATLFFQGWLRQFIDSHKEIDNLCMSVCSGQPPAAKYTCKEDRKNKKYSPKNKPLWYLDV